MEASDLCPLSENCNGGQIQVIFGPMFSGKTTELIRRLKRFQVSNHKCLIIKYANDVRYDDSSIATHDRQVLSAMSATTLEDLRDVAHEYSVIGIDEGQFFPDTVQFAEDMANRGKIVVVAALDGTFQRVGFGNILQLVPLAESVVKLSAVCMVCYKEAAYTKRTSSELALEVIGGSEKYIATCRKCYYLPCPLKRQPLEPLTPTQENGTGASPQKKRFVENGVVTDKENCLNVVPSA